jgi:hypothetical protein
VNKTFLFGNTVPSLTPLMVTGKNPLYSLTTEKKSPLQ